MANLQEIDDEFWEHLNIKNKKRAESKDQQLKALLARIDELQAEQQQLQDAATAAQSQAGNLSTLLSTCRTQLQDSRDQHRMEVEALEQQLAAAQQRLQRNNSDGLNNTAEVENFRKQAAANKADADAANKAAFAYKAEADAALVELQLLKQQLSAASARADQAVKEKQLLLENMQNLLRLNTVLQATLKAEREQQGGAGAARPPGAQEPQTFTPPQPSARPAQQPQQPQQAHQPQQQQQQAQQRDGTAQYQPAQPFVPNTFNKRKQTGAGTAASRKKGKKKSFADAANAAAQEALERNAAAATAAAQRAAEELKRLQERNKQRAEQEKKARAAAAEAAARQKAQQEEQKRRSVEEAQRRAQEQARQQEAMRRAAEEAEKQRQAEEEERLRQQAAAAEARAQQMELAAPQPNLDGMGAGGLKEFLKQAGVDAAATRGVLEKSDLLRVAKAHMQLWECRRIALCGELAQDVHMRLYSAVCVFRISYGTGQDLGSAVRAAKDSLKRTRQRLSLLVHPDKASNELAQYKPVFEEAFKVLTNAHETLTAAADGKYEGSAADPQAQQQQQQQQGGAYGYAGAAPGYTGFPGAWGFAGFPPGFNGFPGAYWQG